MNVWFKVGLALGVVAAVNHSVYLRNKARRLEKLCAVKSEHS